MVPEARAGALLHGNSIADGPRDVITHSGLEKELRSPSNPFYWFDFFFSLPTFLQEMKLMQNSVNGHWVYFSRLFNHALLTVVSNEVLPICSRNWLLRGWSKDFSRFLRESRRCCSPSSGWLTPWSLTCCESRPSESPTWCAGASPRTTETRRWMHFPAALVLQSSSVKFLKFFCRVYLFIAQHFKYSKVGIMYVLESSHCIKISHEYRCFCSTSWKKKKAKSF